MKHTYLTAAFTFLCAATAWSQDTRPSADGKAEQEDLAKEVARDLYSERTDGPVAVIDGHTVLWSDFARFLIQSWGPNAAAAHFGQLTYTELLRQKLDELGLVVTRQDLYDEFVRSYTNSYPDAVPKGETEEERRLDWQRQLEEYERSTQVQSGKDAQSYSNYIWGYAAQSVIIDHLYPEELRRREYAADTDPLFRDGFQVAHILSQTLAEKRTPAEARERIESAKKRLDAGDDWSTVCWEFSDDFRSVASNFDRPSPLADGSPYPYLLGMLADFKAGACPFGESMTAAARSVDAPGGLSDIFETEFGFHILKLVSTTPRPTYEQAARRVHGSYSGKFMTQIKAEGKIENLILGTTDWNLEPFASWTTTQNAGEPSTTDVVVALVNGKPLYLSDFGRLLYVNVGPREGVSHRQNLIEDCLLHMAARELGITVTPEEVEAVLEAQYQEAIKSGVSPRVGLEAWLALRGQRSRVGPSESRTLQRTMIQHDRTRSALAGPEQVQRYYEENRTLYNEAVQCRVVVLYHYDKRRTAAEGKTLADSILGMLQKARATLPPERLARPEEDYFDLLVQPYTDHTISKRVGGNLNLWSPGPDATPGTSGMGGEFEQAVLAAGDKGVGVAPVHGGWAVFEVLSIRPGRSLEEATEDIRKALRDYAGHLLIRKHDVQLVRNLLGLPEANSEK